MFTSPILWLLENAIDYLVPQYSHSLLQRFTITDFHHFMAATSIAY